jgi:NTP pyrophosphatase (non-canonical NTP hydrolase)
MDIDDLVTIAYAAALEKGFTQPGRPRTVEEHVALLVTELGEMFECQRDGMLPYEIRYLHKGRTGPDRITRTAGHDLDEQAPEPIGIPVELADLVIRAANMAGEYGINLAEVIAMKLRYNANRPHLHGRQA